jgi:hypothetical protein
MAFAAVLLTNAGPLASWPAKKRVALRSSPEATHTDIRLSHHETAPCGTTVNVASRGDGR